MFTSSDIRDRFLNFFQNNGHTLVSSSSLVPGNDPTLLFTNAGMVQFKKVFLGQEKREYSRAVTAQKCLRVGGKHNDLENVGRTARHHTFFEMLGNFSFGDYFKDQAIDLAWKFLTREMGLDPDRLYITIFRDDDEAMDLWKKIAGVSGDRIFRLDEKDNFWSMGDTGPCGPCSEILYDQGEKVSCGPDCGIGVCDCDRYLEIWNLVFMQYDRDEQGNLNPLPRPSIDTGMGLERISAVSQGVFSNYDTDLFRQLIDFMANLAKVTYGRNEEHDVALRVISDHSRAAAFMIADGMLPSNEGRGYILRRLIRRAYRFGRSLGMEEPFLHKVSARVVKAMDKAYPELGRSLDFMGRVIRQEEERFAGTLEKGLIILEDEIADLEVKGQGTIPGEVAFKLYDTYGFPLDIVNDIAEKKGLKVDEQGFNSYMDQQKSRAKAAWKGAEGGELFAALGREAGDGFEVEFVGYDRLRSLGRVAFLLDSNGELKDELPEGLQGWLVSTITPFYGESGGQAGDRGRISSGTGQARVEDARKPYPGITVHKIVVTSGTLSRDQEIDLVVDDGQRISTARNHTATHLLHSALRRVLGDHVKQAGSLVEDKRLRFDFTHIKALEKDELARIEEDVNRSILADIPVETVEMEHEQAVEKGALALFGEKYSSRVRVVSLGDVSMELCGGTHLRSTAQAGSFCIISEGAVAAGVRRIEAITGWDALKYWQSRRSRLESLQELLKAGPDQVTDKVSSLQEQLRQVSKENKALKEKLSSGASSELASSAREVAGIRFIARKIEDTDMNGLRKIMDDTRSKMESGVVLLGSVNNSKPSLLLFVSKDLHQRFTAPQLIKEVAAEIKGSGGGRPDLAQAGGADPDGLDRALARLEEVLLKD
ncbi:alanine--tRNA ligase [Desulfonatronovibrio hydrogenovorans]|uniref:alanine--tRNA ligase n=1 Tax=Desulfonatronovibrio hydrogenovorans TaxID=53245 RepID=UPI00048EF640|nr:alanine--tRNA ligase [Desulfonatronovibrio hydrogenovorans]